MIEIPDKMMWSRSTTTQKKKIEVEILTGKVPCKVVNTR